MKTKLFLLSTLVVISATSVSNAADVIYSSPVAPEYNEISIWRGAYIGGQVGYDWAKNKISSDNALINNLRAKPKGFVGGLYAGYNWEFSNAYVFGLEGDINYADLSEDTNGTVLFNALTGRATWNTRIRWEGAVRARFGVNYGRWLPYLAGGVALAGVKDKVRGTIFDTAGNILSDGSNDISKTRVGFTVGAGVDYALTNNLILRAEYRYSDYGKKNIFGNNSESKLTTNNVRLGIAYKF